MADRPVGYGLTKEVKEKMEKKYDEKLEQQARLWMESVVGEQLSESVDSSEALGLDRFHECLKNGQFLCKLMNAITGNNEVKYTTSNFAFKQMENIAKFLSAADKYGLKVDDLFQTVDLYEKLNMWQVVLTIQALSRKAFNNGDVKTFFGPKEAVKNVRTFNAESELEARQVISFWSGPGANTVASQSGMSFGLPRQCTRNDLAPVSREGEGIHGFQAGAFKGANQSGINFGLPRQIKK